jgi:flagellin
MSEITLSKAVRSNLLNLQSTASLLSKSQERLSSGLRVNSALDNPTNFFTAQGLNSRASDLSQLADAVSNAVQTVAAADKGITAITKLVESAQATARQALQTAATVPNTTVSAEATVTGSVALSDDAAAVNSGTGGTLTGTDTLLSLGFADGETITMDIGGTVTTYTITDASAEDVDALVAALDLNADGGVTLTGGNIVATATANTDSITFGGTGDVTGLGLTTTAVGPTNTQLTTTLAGQTLTIAGNTLTFGSGANIGTRAELDAALGALTGGVTGSVNGSDNIVFTGSGGDSFTVGGTAATAVGITAQAYDATTTTTDIANPKRAELVSTYNDLLGQIDALAKDSGFNGVNLLNGDNLSVIFNEDGSSKIDIQGVDNTTGVSGLNLAALTSTSFDTNTGVNDVLDDLKGTIDTLRSQSAKFGSNLSVVETRQDFTKQMISVLQTGAANLTLADSNEEAANVLALQTRQQLSSTALSLASQADQNVLRLF